MFFKKYLTPMYKFKIQVLSFVDIVSLTVSKVKLKSF